MISHLEVELKQVVSHATFNRLIELFPQHELLKQTNHYYRYESKDTRIACRIRELNNTLTLTFKQKHPQGVLETNFPVRTCDPSVFHLPEVKAFLEVNGLFDQWTSIGSLETHRHLVRHTFGELCIDKNYYLGQIDYELEYETSSAHEKEAKEEFLKLLNELDVVYVPASSKFERFLLRLLLAE